MTNSKVHVVIVGGGYAGLAAARKLRQLAAQLTITLIDEKTAFFERIRLHEVAAGGPHRTWAYREVLGSMGIEFVQGRVQSIDLARRCVRLESSEVTYTHLIYALGSSSPSVPGASVLSSPAHSTELAQQLAKSAGQLTVVGAGLTGLELATEVAEHYSNWRVTLVAGDALQARHVPGGYSEAAIQAITRTLRRLRITLVEAGRAVGVHHGVVRLTDGLKLSSDLTVWTTGFAVPRLAKEAGLEVNAQGQIVTDQALRSVSHPEVIAIGDAAEAVLRDGEACRMGCATGLAMAMTGARTVADLTRGQSPTQRFEFSYLFRNISLGRHDALIQFVDRFDRPRSVVWSGPRAVEWKEYICRGTLSTCGLVPNERPPRMPPLVLLPQLFSAMTQYA